DGFSEQRRQARAVQVGIHRGESVARGAGTRDSGFDGYASAASTSSACSSTFTLSHRCCTLPSGPIRYVVRTIPMNLRPMKDFSCQTPYFSATSWSGSASSGNVMLYLSANFALLFASRMLTPRTAALLGLNFGRYDWNEHVSFVQPGVSSFG